jgi:hypothetical protein
MSLQISLTVRGDNIDPVAVPSTTITQAGLGGGNPGMKDVGTTEETVDFGDVTPGLVVLSNTDATNFVEWGFSTGVRPGRLLPNGAPTVIHLSGGTLYVRANAAACRIKVRGYEA